MWTIHPAPSQCRPARSRGTPLRLHSQSRPTKAKRGSGQDQGRYTKETENKNNHETPDIESKAKGRIPDPCLEERQVRECVNPPASIYHSSKASHTRLRPARQVDPYIACIYNFSSSFPPPPFFFPRRTGLFPTSADIWDERLRPHVLGLRPPDSHLLVGPCTPSELVLG